MNLLNVILSYSPLFWLAILIICCVIEAFTLALTTIWPALAALPMIFIAKTGLGFKWQLLIFAIITILLIVFTRPFAIKKLKIGKNKTNVDTMIGEEVLVTKVITKFQKGEAKAKNGVIWTTTTTDDSELSEGTTAKVVKVEGNTLFVSAN